MILKNSDFKTHTQAHTLFKIQQIAQVPLPLYLFLSIILCKARIRGEGRNIWSTPPRARACTRTVQQSNVCIRNFPYTHTHTNLMPKMFENFNHTSEPRQFTSFFIVLYTDIRTLWESHRVSSWSCVHETCTVSEALLCGQGERETWHSCIKTRYIK